MGCHLNVLVAWIQLVRQIAHILFFDQFEGIVYLHEYVHEIEWPILLLRIQKVLLICEPQAVHRLIHVLGKFHQEVIRALLGTGAAQMRIILSFNSNHHFPRFMAILILLTVKMPLVYLLIDPRRVVFSANISVGIDILNKPASAPVTRCAILRTSLHVATVAATVPLYLVVGVGAGVQERIMLPLIDAVVV